MLIIIIIIINSNNNKTCNAHISTLLGVQGAVKKRRRKKKGNFERARAPRNFLFGKGHPIDAKIRNFYRDISRALRQ